MWQLTGQRGEDKLDPGARDSTIKRLAAFYSTPTVIEDNASSNKVWMIMFLIDASLRMGAFQMRFLSLKISEGIQIMMN